MKIEEFISIGLRSGDKIRVTIAGQTYEGYFGGYNMIEGIRDLDNYSVFPVFYAIGKLGQMVRRSLVPGRTSWWPLDSIEDCKKIKAASYRHIGYYNNPKDCMNLSFRGYEAALKAWKKGYGAFCSVDNGDVFDDIGNDNDTRILEGGRYAVRFSGIYNTDKQEDYGGYIDIFERVNDTA